MRWQWWVEAYFVMNDTHTLPESGGYFNQDWLYMEILNEIRSTYLAEVKKASNGKV